MYSVGEHFTAKQFQTWVLINIFQKYMRLQYLMYLLCGVAWLILFSNFDEVFQVWCFFCVAFYIHLYFLDPSSKMYGSAKVHLSLSLGQFNKVITFALISHEKSLNLVIMHCIDWYLSERHF